MKRLLIVLLVLISVSAAEAAVFRIFLGPVVSTYTGQWPNPVFSDWGTATGGLSPFHNSRTSSLNGLGIELPLCRGVALGVDGFFFGMGAVFTRPTLVFSSQRERYELQGLGFSILVKLSPLPKYYPYLLGGFGSAFFTSHSRTSSIEPEASPYFAEVSREDLGLATNKIDAGPIVGLGFEFPISRWTLFAEARYRAGLVDLVKGIPGAGHAVRVRSVSFVVGYKL